MKKINKYIGITIIVVFVLLINTLSVSAHSGHDKLIDDIVAEILDAQNVSSVDNIDCDKITGSRLEELGEAVMSIMHPNEQQHEIMDKMMGGEGSDTLKNMHIMMGQRYLGCTDSMAVDMGSTMMGGMGMMDGGQRTIQNNDFGHMDNYTTNSMFMIPLWLFLFSGSAAFIKIMFNKK